MGHEWRDYDAVRAQREAERKRIERRDKSTMIIIGIVVALLVAGFVWAILLGIDRHEREYAQFMRECTQDRKHYECVAMWRAGEPSTVPVVIPMPIPYGN